MDKLTIKEQRLQIKKWYLMTQTSVPDYLKDENHRCDPDSYDLDRERCPACKELWLEKIKKA